MPYDFYMIPVGLTPERVLCSGYEIKDTETQSVLISLGCTKSIANAIIAYSLYAQENTLNSYKSCIRECLSQLRQSVTPNDVLKFIAYQATSGRIKYK